MEFWGVVFIGFIFCVIQFWISNKIKKAWIKCIPIGITVLGLLFCFVLYLNIFWTNSPSVIAENRLLAWILVIPFTTAFIGCLIGGITCKLFGKLNK